MEGSSGTLPSCLLQYLQGSTENLNTAAARQHLGILGNDCSENWCGGL